MRWNRGLTSWILSLLLLSGIAALFLLPVLLTATILPNLGTGTFPDLSRPLDPVADALEVQQLLETTYLGRGKEVPDPGEPAVVLLKYLEQNAHGYQHSLIQDQLRLDAELTAWRGLVQRHPQSRHALVALAKHHRTKAQVSGDINHTRQAADAYLQAAEINLANGRIGHTRELSDLLVTLGDTKGLDDIFGRMLAQPKGQNRDNYYLALVDYADGLARLGDERAWDYFEEAIDFHPENHDAAINRYVKHLLDRGQAQRALEILDTRLTSEQRIGAFLPAFFRREALAALGLDTASADAEIAARSQPSIRRMSPSYSSNPAQRADTNWKAAESGSIVSLLWTPAVAVATTTDPGVSTLFGVLLDDPNTTTNPDLPRIQHDAIFAPNGAINNRWQTMSPTQNGKKIASTRWPNGTAALARIGTDNKVHYRYFNGSSWGNWINLDVPPIANLTPGDIAIAARAPSQVDIFIVGSDNHLYQRQSSNNGVNWANWIDFVCCATEVALAASPNGTLHLAAQANGSPNNSVWVSRFVNNTWVWNDLGQPPDGLARDLALLSYVNANLTMWTVGATNCNIYFWMFNGTNWSGPALWSNACYKSVSSFPTSDGGAYILFLGTSNNTLHTQRFTGTSWGGVVAQGTRKWISTAGINIDQDDPYEHTENNDDCRTQNTYKADPITGELYSTDGINWAEVMYNEARGETVGAQAIVGWTVRNRAYRGLQSPSTCGTYPGAQSGGAVTMNCRSTVPCSDPSFCEDSRQVCCVIHGGQTQLGTSGHQFNDEHVDMATLSIEGLLVRMQHLSEGRLLDMSNPSWKPDGISSCPQTLACGTTTGGGPLCMQGVNIKETPKDGPMEFRSFDYCASTNGAPLTSCKKYAGDVCGNTDSNSDGNPVEVPMNSACPSPNTSRGSDDNFFWNRKP